MSNCKNSEDARRGIWAYTFDEIKEIIELIHWTRKGAAKAEKSSLSKEMVDSAYGPRPVHSAIEHRMLQFLAVKLASVFENQGGGTTEAGKEISDNKSLLSGWKSAMKTFASSKVENSQDIQRILNRLRDDRHGMIAHRQGKYADVTHEQGGTIIFRADPIPLTENELVALREYVVACKYFCEKAHDCDDGPKLTGLAEMALPNSKSGY